MARKSIKTQFIKMLMSELSVPEISIKNRWTSGISYIYLHYNTMQEMKDLIIACEKWIVANDLIDEINIPSIPEASNHGLNLDGTGRMWIHIRNDQTFWGFADEIKREGRVLGTGY